MRRILLVFSGIICAILFCSCWNYINVPVSGDLFYHQAEEPTLVWGTNTYHFYGFTNEKSLRGDLIGAVNGDEEMIVYMVKGYSSDDWIMQELNVFMSRGQYTLYINEYVQEIPEEFELVGDGDYQLKYYVKQ